MRNKSFDWGSFLKAMAVIAVPVAVQNLLTTTGSMIDTMMIAALGELQVGAVGLCAQFSSLMFSGYWGFVGGGMLFFAQYWGAQDEDGIDRAFGTTVSCMMLVGILFAGMAAFFPELVMKIYTDKQSIQAVGVEYLRYVWVGYIFNILSMAVSALLRSTERVKLPMIAAFASVGTNVLLNWILIYGKFGFPALGVVGAAIATACAGIVNFLVLVILAKVNHFPYLFQFSKHFRWTKEWLAEYFKKCFPIICNEVLVGIGFMIINIVLGRQSEQAIAATAVFRTLEGLIIGFFAGFSNAASILVGKEVGAGQLRIAYDRAIRLIYVCGACIMTVVLIILAAHKPILTVMSLSGESYRICTGMLLIYGFFCIIRMMNWVQNDTFRSAGDSSYGTILEIAFMYATVIPCVCITGFVLKAPFLVIFASCYVDELIRFYLMQKHCYSGKWIKPVTEQGIKALEQFKKTMR